MKPVRDKSRRSLRTILIFWFITFSVVPLAFISYYSVRKFESAIDHELTLRLSGNAREIISILDDYRQSLQSKKEKFSKDPNLIYHLSIGDAATLKTISTESLVDSMATSVSFYDRDGRLLSSVFKDQKGELRSFLPSGDKVLLNEKYRAHLKDKEDLGLADFADKKKISLILFSRLNTTSGRLAGYTEQMIDLDRTFLIRLKNKMRLETGLYRDDGKLITATASELTDIAPNTFFDEKKSDIFFDIDIQKNPFGVLLYPIEWDKSKFYLAIGASKAVAKEVLRNVNLAFFSVVSTVMILVLITVIFTSQWILRPIYQLIASLQRFETSDSLIEVEVTNQTEIGLLTKSFNQISKKIVQARSDLKKKIKELEGTNQELKDTQAKLVHSAKMVSLGQLVAGVAHELNNPISFIYSNMTHLKDYGEKLIKFVHLAVEANPSLKIKADELEIDYIEKDLPKLVASCEDGARRTKEIVLGLRNFSRLEEAMLKEIDVRESLDNTLNLLQGEIKNRIQIHRQYEPVPNILCYASQINQVFMNILSNAVQAIDGPGQIWISTMPIKSSSERSGQVQISIQDSGKGMSSDVLEKIFDPFFTTKGVGQGTGLGLSISYGIIQNHGGEIQVRSQVNVGTEFVVTIPIEPPTFQLLE